MQAVVMIVCNYQYLKFSVHSFKSHFQITFVSV